MYSIDEVRDNTLKYFNGDEMATDVWINKYALRDKENNLLELSPDDMHHRLAKEFARIENKYPNPLSEDEIYSYLKDFKYIVPQGGSMAGVGNNHKVVSLSNCFVVHNKYDSFGSISNVLQEMIQISKRRGGVGTDLSGYRNRNAPINNSAVSSTGIVPFAQLYSDSISMVAQNGRRGALMLSVSIKHPDSEEFIDAKLEDGRINDANISVKITDEFMKAVQNDEEFVQQFPIDSNDPISKKVIKAKKLWDKIVENAWKSAEPGILFWDNIIKNSPADSYADEGYATIATNPCGELPLPNHGSCILLVLNLYSYVINPFTKKATFNMELFQKHVKIAQRMVDDIVDLEIEKVEAIIEKVKSDPEPEDIKIVELSLWKGILKKHKDSRRTGLGITALGDMFAALGIKYASKKSFDISNTIFGELSRNSYISSIELAQERGAFNIFDYEKEKDNLYLRRMYDTYPAIEKSVREYGRRNIANMTIAPTGTVSIMTQTTSGIEPVFRVAYKRRRKINPNDTNSKVSFIDKQGNKWEEYLILHPKFKEYANINNIDISDDMSQDELDIIIAKSPYNKSTSSDVDWVNKVSLQGTIQKYIDHAISATTNIPNDTDVDTVNDIYYHAWKSGCKGMTIYRDGSREGILINNTPSDIVNKLIKENNAPKRPKHLKCEIFRFVNDKKNWIGFLGIYQDKETGEEFPYELFTGLEESFVIPNYVESGIITKNKDSEGNKTYSLTFKDKDNYNITLDGLDRAFNKKYWSAGKLVSALLRHRIHLPTVINLVDVIVFDDNSTYMFGTWQSGVKRILKKYLKSGLGEVCPSCGSSNYKRTDGCAKCLDCGYSACS